ncbi:PKD domain-containing protein, partial [candidate division KSB1 bacterium]|nr:PKD domain-containing protein [candidate division KSB1 bacterium]
VSGVPNPNGPVYYLVSKDGGEKFSNLGDIHSSECNYQSRNGSPDVAVDSIGRVHICYGFSEDLTRSEEPSVRYAHFRDNAKLLDKAATPKGFLSEWEKAGMGLGSLACSDNGQVVVIAFSEKPGGNLYTTMSQDTGKTWNAPIKIVATSGADEGRNKHFIRSKGGKFYLVYPHNYNVYLRILSVPINEPPFADAGGPYNLLEGSIHTFDASNSFDPDGMIAKYEWDWKNDGTYDATSAAAIYNYSYPDNFTGQVKLRVTDDKGATKTDLANITVANVSPTANAGGPYQGVPGVVIPCNGSATDPGKDDILAYAWDVDSDGIFETNGQNINVQFPRGGNYKIVLRVTDDDGGVGLDTTTVQIASKPPIVSLIPAQTIDEGSSFNKINLDDYVSDPDNKDADITWQVRGNVNLEAKIDANRIATIRPINENWFGSETLTFIAIDPAQLKDSTSTLFTVKNVNDPPVVTRIPQQYIYEGEERFTPINLDNYVTDVDNAKSEIIWSLERNVKLSYEIENRILTVFPLDLEWAGVEELLIIAKDPGGLTDTSITKFKVNGINDPPVISEIPGQQRRVGEEFTPIKLDNYVKDPDHADRSIVWTVFGNTNLIITITDRIATITRAKPDWIGSETISFIATDPLGAADTAKAVFASVKNNLPPKVSKIPDQTILEGNSFTAIPLDGYVSDPDDIDAQLTWRVTGQKELIITIESRIAHIVLPDGDWNGSETIKFKASDPEGLSDSTLAIFTVIPVNDPPVMAALPDFKILEDDTLKWSLSYLRSLVTDPDNAPEDFKFQISNNVNLSWLNDAKNNQICIYGLPNWHGVETITVTVTDGSNGSDSKPCKIIVESVPDTPMPFSLLFPDGKNFSSEQDTIVFTWQIAHDPEGGNSMYQLNISDDLNFIHVIDQFNNLVDTTFAYVTSSKLKTGHYFWKIRAFNSIGFTESNMGRFHINLTGISENDEATRPEQFALLQNYPNPFNPETWIVYQLPERSDVSLEIYNSLGQRVAAIETCAQDPGTHRIKWNAKNEAGQQLPSGIYICRLQAGDKSFNMKMILLQ